MDLLEAHDVAFRIDPMESLPSLADPDLRGLDRREDRSRIPSRYRQRGPRKIKGRLAPASGGLLRGASRLSGATTHR
eukprot:1950934-Heterocapsa_arctica.AAC.1